VFKRFATQKRGRTRPPPAGPSLYRLSTTTTPSFSTTCASSMCQ
jgi:hypothetical protein